MPQGRMDVHRHVIPPRYQAFLDERGISTGGLAPVCRSRTSKAA